MPEPQTPDLRLRVDGQDYGGWTMVQVRRSLDTVCGTFELSVSERWPGRARRWAVTAGDACQVLINGQVVITGWVDDVEARYESDAHEILVRGRDRTGDLVDCCRDEKPDEWSGAKLEAIAAELCRPFGIGVHAAADTGQALPHCKFNEGETVFSFIEKLARQRAVLVHSDPRGDLVLARAGEGGQAGDALELGVNVKAGSSQVSHRERFSRYTVKGQGAGFEGAMPEIYAGPAGHSQDQGVRRFRPFVVLAECQGLDVSHQDRARWEASSRAGKALKLTYQTQGWWQRDGRVWPLNAMVRVRDAYFGLDRELLVVGLTWRLDNRGGAVTSVEVMPREACELIPMMPPGADWAGFYRLNSGTSGTGS